MDILKFGRRVHVALSVPSHAVVLALRCYHVEEVITSMYGDVDGVRFLYPRLSQKSRVRDDQMERPKNVSMSKATPLAWI